MTKNKSQVFNVLMREEYLRIRKKSRIIIRKRGRSNKNITIIGFIYKIYWGGENSKNIVPKRRRE